VKQAYHHNDLRNALIEEAIKVLRESGIGGLTLRELARRLGVTHAAPYAHFADKQQLLIGVADVGFGLLADELVSAQQGHSDPAEAFVAMGVAYVRFAQSNPDLYRLMFVEADLPEEECEMSEEGERAFQILVKAIARLESPLPVPSEELAVAAWAMVHGVAMLEIDSRMKTKTSKSSVELLTLASKVFLRGMGEPTHLSPAHYGETPR
jgi:AcrR family transcriptional regulator